MHINIFLMFFFHVAVILKQIYEPHLFKKSDLCFQNFFPSIDRRFNWNILEKSVINLIINHFLLSN